MRVLTLAIALLAAAAPLTGCLTAPEDERPPAADAEPTPPSPSPSAPEPRTTTVSGSVGGTKNDARDIVVAPGTKRLEVEATWSLGGTAYFALKEPDGAIAKEDAVSGGSAYGPREWYAIDNPTPGTWSFSLSISGGGTYDFDFAH